MTELWKTISKSLPRKVCDLWIYNFNKWHLKFTFTYPLLKLQNNIQLWIQYDLSLSLECVHTHTRRCIYIFHAVCISVQFSRSVVSNSLRPHEPQHLRPPCPSPIPRVYPNSSIESVMPSNHLILCHPINSIHTCIIIYVYISAYHRQILST